MRKIIYKVRREHVLIKALVITAIALVMMVGIAGASYSYMNININGSTQNNYQINMIIPWESGMNSDFSNIRFFADNTSTNMSVALPYWIESQTSGSSANIWVPLPANCTKVVCEWGLLGQTTSQSNISQVMDFGDDFNDNILNTSKWTVTNNVAISNGICYVTGNSGKWTSSYLKSATPSIAENTITECRVTTAHAQLGTAENVILVNTAGSSDFDPSVWWNSGNNPYANKWNWVDSSGTWHQGNTITGYTPNTFAKIAFWKMGTTEAMYLNGVLEQTIPSNQYATGACSVVFEACGDTSQQTSIDYIFTHKYNATPPTVTVDPTVYNGLGSANFTSNVTRGFAQLTVAFTDLSVGNPTSWNWNFGDGATSTQQNPTHTYTTAGYYTVTLTVSNANDTDSKLSTIIVSEKTAPVLPVANEKFTIEVKPPEGAVLTFTRTLPPSIVGGEYYPVY